jgi:hypothetical protein
VGTSHNPIHNPYSFGQTIPTPSAGQSLLPKPHGKAQIFIHSSRRPQPASQSDVAVTPTPGTNSGIDMGVQTRQSQSLPRLQQDHSKSTSPAIADQEQRIYSSSDRQLEEPGRTAIFSANPALLQPASPGQHIEARPVPQSPPAETSRLRPELADIFRTRIRPFSEPAIQSVRTQILPFSEPSIQACYSGCPTCIDIPQCCIWSLSLCLVCCFSERWSLRPTVVDNNFFFVEVRGCKYIS